MLNIKNVKIEIVKKDITNVQLAEKLGMNVNTISRWLNGNNLEQIEKFLEMLKILDLNVNDIKE